MDKGKLESIWGKPTRNGELDHDPFEDFWAPSLEIGSKPKNDEPWLMYSWVSDYINKDGSLVNEKLRDSGLVPCTPPDLMLQRSVMEGETGKSSSSFKQQRDPFQNKAPNLSVGSDDKVGMPFQNGVGCDSYSSSSGYDTGGPFQVSPMIGQALSFQGNNEFEPVPTVSQEEPSANFCYYDALIFDEEYGYGAEMRPGLRYRPRKGKYFKKFGEY